MTQEDRDRVVAALMGPALERAPGLQKELEEMCVEDLDRLEPIIDGIVAREVTKATRAASSA
jgi:hypothetical protein